MNLMMDLSKFTSNKNILNEIVAKLCPIIILLCYYFHYLSIVCKREYLPILIKMISFYFFEIELRLHCIKANTLQLKYCSNFFLYPIILLRVCSV